MTSCSSPSPRCTLSGNGLRPPTISTRTCAPCWSVPLWTRNALRGRGSASSSMHSRAAVGGADGGDEDSEVLRLALRKLPRRQGAVLVLRFFYDLSVEEGSATLGWSTCTVKSQ